MNGPALQMQGVSFAYSRGPEAARDVELAVARGERVALAGPNGAGKSTVLKLAAGILRARRGAISLLGRPAGELTRAEAARRVAWVPQEVETAFPFTVAEVVLMGRYPHLGPLGFETRRDIEIAERCMGELGVSDLADRPYANLSGGQKKRAVLASALAQEPMLLLLDEPTAGLDAAGQVDLGRVLARLAGRGIGVLLVTHDLNLAGRLCDSCVLMHQGSVAARGRPEEVLTEERLSKLYGVKVAVAPHPVDGLPIVLPDLSLDYPTGSEEGGPCGS